jgi:hypothetical protein
MSLVSGLEQQFQGNLKTSSKKKVNNRVAGLIMMTPGPGDVNFSSTNSGFRSGSKLLFTDLAT